MEKFRKQSSERRGFEQLEDRSLMAGNVTAAVSQGLLELKGDNKANYLVIHETGKNQYQVQGIGTNLTYGGKTASSFTFKSVTNLTADLAAGNDSLTLYNSTFKNGIVSASMGAGNDVVSVSNVKAQVVAVDLGDGNDVASFVKINTTTSYATFAVYGGNGTDAIALNSVKTEYLYADVGAGNFDSLAIALCSATEAELDDTSGTNGVLTRAGNKFKTQTVYGFKFVV